MCFVIFACVASTLVWDLNGYAYMGYGAGATGADPGYYGGTYGYSSSYMTPQSAKAAMISVTAINFLVSLGFLVGSFSRTRVTRGCRFYFSIFVCDIILAVLQVSLPRCRTCSSSARFWPRGVARVTAAPRLCCGFKVIIDIVFVIGVNPMSQSSQSALYNPMLMMCQSIQSNPSLSGGLGGGFPGGFPMYNRYLYHYCYMDPEEVRLLFNFTIYSSSLMGYFYVFSGGCIRVGYPGGRGPLAVGVLRLQDPQQDLETRQSQHLLGPAFGGAARGPGGTRLGECVVFVHTHAQTHTGEGVWSPDAGFTSLLLLTHRALWPHPGFTLTDH